MTRSLAPLLALVLAACGIFAARAPYDRGVEALERKDYATAIRELEESVRLNADSQQAQNALGLAYMNSGRWSDAWPHVRRAYTLDPHPAPWGNCLIVWPHVVQETRLAVGDSTALVLQKIGEPDARKDRDGALYWGYGPKVLVFRADRLADELTMPKPSP